MKIYMDLGYLIGHLRYGHLEGEVPLSEEEEKEFKELLKKDLEDKPLTEEEADKLLDYKEIIRDYCDIKIDDYEIDGCGDYYWEELLEED